MNKHERICDTVFIGESWLLLAEVLTNTYLDVELHGVVKGTKTLLAIARHRQ